MMNASLPTTRVEDQLEFNGELFPFVVTPPKALSLAEACDWIGDHREAIENQLAKSGTLLFRGFPVSDADSFDAFSAAFGYPPFLYQESLSNAVRINFTERVFTANEAPKDVEIFLS